MKRSTSAYSFKKIEDVPRSSSLIELRPSIIDEFSKFISKYSTFLSHNYNVVRAGDFPNNKTFYIPDDIFYNDFINYYSRMFTYLSSCKTMEYIFNFSQKQQNIGPLMLNIDFKFNETDFDESINHFYNEDDILNIIKYVNSLIKQYFEISDIKCYLQEKSKMTVILKNDKIKYIKDGFHLCYIYPFSKEQRLFILNKLKLYCMTTRILEHLHFINDYDYTFNEDDIFKNNWLMYGSYKFVKNNSRVYYCRYYYDSEGNKKDFVISFEDKIKLFDVRQFNTSDVIPYRGLIE